MKTLNPESARNSKLTFDLNHFANFILILLLLIHPGCKTTQPIPIFENRNADEPFYGFVKEVVDPSLSYSFKTYITSTIIYKPKKDQLKKFKVPKALSKLKNYYVIDFDNDQSTILISHFPENYKIYPQLFNTNEFSPSDTNYHVIKLDEADVKSKVVYKLIEINNQKMIVFHCFTYQSLTDATEYQKSQLQNLINTFEVNPMDKANKEIQKSLYSFMATDFKNNHNYFRANYYLNNLADSIYQDNKDGIDTYRTFAGILPQLNVKDTVIKVKASSYISAKQHLKEVSKGYDITLFNEEHNSVYDRYLLTSYLKTFKENGYTKLGLETLSYYTNHNINDLKYPIHGSGFYSDEPNYANLIREAKHLGFHVFAYEATSSECDTCKSSLQKRTYREQTQAKRLLEKHLSIDKGKTLVLAGWAHINKTAGFSSIKMMAEHLAQQSGLKVLSVNQTYQNSYEQSSTLKEDIIPLNSSGGYLLAPRLLNKVDFQLLHRSDKYDQLNRIHEDGEEMTFEVNDLKDGYFVVYSKKEREANYKMALPIYIEKIKSNKTTIKLTLRKDEYKFLKYDKYGYFTGM